MKRTLSSGARVSTTEYVTWISLRPRLREALEDAQRPGLRDDDAGLVVVGDLHREVLDEDAVVARRRRSVEWSIRPLWPSRLFDDDGDRLALVAADVEDVAAEAADELERRRSRAWRTM